MSLQDQLLKAGLISADKAKQAESEKRKNTHQKKKDKRLAAQDAAAAQEHKRRLAAQEQAKKARDLALNQAREREKQARAEQARIRQVLDQQRKNEKDAEIRYHFCADGRIIHFLFVTPQQQRQLASGLLGIVDDRDGRNEFALVPRETALEIAAVAAERLLLLYPQSNNHAADDTTPE